jgi:hypothetical protein
VPRFEVRLESPDLEREDGTPHFRVTRLVADDADAARTACQRKEYELAAFRLPPAELEDAEAQEADGELSSQTRGRLASHRQERPYDVVSVTEIEED